MKIALIPAYNSVHTIAETVIKTKRYVDRVIMFDDGSTDATGLIAKECGALVLVSDKNRGKGFALGKLFYTAKKMSPDITITLDADMQHNPDDIPKLIEPILEDKADITIGVRRNIPKIRSFGNKILDKLSRKKLEDTQSGFRAYNSKVLKEITITETGFGVDSQILLGLLPKFRLATVPISTKSDEFSHRKNFVLHFIEVFNYIFLRKPLLHLGILGGLGFFVGVLGLSDVINTWNLYEELALGTFLFSMTMILLGALTFFVGLILHVIRSEKKNVIRCDDTHKKQ